MTPTHPTPDAHEIRFGFGENWSQFLTTLSDARIAEAEKALLGMLEATGLEGKRFLDIGSGSGLMSLAARRAGAEVTSFDYDPQSVACTAALRERFYPNDPHWRVLQGSVLDAAFMRSLGAFDVVYAWGVLHHTGDMWTALDHAALPMAPGGQLLVAIYNDQGAWSRRWTALKRLYNQLPPVLRLPYALLTMGPREAKFFLFALLKGRPGAYLKSWSAPAGHRGMNRWHDLVDWIGGYPFEVAKPEALLDFYRPRGLALIRLRTCGGGMGCNEFVLQKGT